MPTSSTLTNIWKSESMLMPPRNKSDVAAQMMVLRRKTMAAKSASTSHKDAQQPKAEKPTTNKKTCLCSPTTHPGSFRCRLHRAAAGWHHPPATAEEKNSRGTPSLNLKGAGNPSPARVSRFCSSR